MGLELGVVVPVIPALGSQGGQAAEALRPAWGLHSEIQVSWSSAVKLFLKIKGVGVGRSGLARHDALNVQALS